MTGGSCLQNTVATDTFRNSWSPTSIFALNTSSRAGLVSGMCGQRQLLQQGYHRADISIGAMADEQPAGAIWPLPPVAHSKLATTRWITYLQKQGFTPADFGNRSWSDVMPLGRQPVSGDDEIFRRLFYWTARFIAWDATDTYAAATKLSQQAFSKDVLVYMNCNNFGGRFFYPNSPVPGNNPPPGQLCPGESCGVIAFDWLEFGRLRGASILWTEVRSAS